MLTITLQPAISPQKGVRTNRKFITRSGVGSILLTCRPRCELLVFFLLSLNRTSVAADHSYPPMGNCCGSAAMVPSQPQPAPPVELRPSARAPSQPKVNESSVPPSSRPPFRSRGLSSASQHESTLHGGRSSQDTTPRSRTKSAPQPPQTFKSSSPQDPRPRTRSVVQSKRSSRADSRPTGPGEINRKRPMNI
jgi:hypothetical protein